MLVVAVVVADGQLLEVQLLLLVVLVVLEEVAPADLEFSIARVEMVEMVPQQQDLVVEEEEHQVQANQFL
jgi:hypothetical protein